MKIIGRYLGTGPCLRKRRLGTVAMDLADAALNRLAHNAYKINLK